MRLLAIVSSGGGESATPVFCDCGFGYFKRKGDEYVCKDCGTIAKVDVRERSGYTGAEVSFKIEEVPE